MDRDASSRQLFETLRARLGSLSEALFDKAPCTRRSASRPATNSFRGSGPDLLILCRGLSAVDTVLRRFEQKWYRLTVEDRLAIWNEWDIRLERLHGDVRDPCGLCFVAPGFGAPAAATSYDCAVCSHRVTSFTEEMERYARRLDDNLEYLAAVSSSPPPVAHPTSEPSPAPEPPATPVPPPVPDDTAKDDRIRELETKCQDYSEILEQTQDVLQAVNAEKTAQEETAKALLEDLATLRKAREESEALSKLLGNDLQEAMNGIEKYAEDLDDLMRWRKFVLMLALSLFFLSTIFLLLFYLFHGMDSPRRRFELSAVPERPRIQGIVCTLTMQHRRDGAGCICTAASLITQATGPHYCFHQRNNTRHRAAPQGA